MKARTHFLNAFVLLSSFSLVDQWKKPVDWKNFEKVPVVAVLGGKNAAKESKTWCDLLNKEFNPNYKPSPGNLQSISAEEKIKLVRVISLPEVPKLLRRMFFTGFKKESSQSGVALDFENTMGKAYEYDEKSPAPLVIISSKKTVVGIFGKSSDVETKSKVLEGIKKALDVPIKN